MARSVLDVNAYAASPNSRPLAFSITSSKSDHDCIGATGPNGSSYIMRALSGTSASTVGE